MKSSNHVAVQPNPAPREDMRMRAANLCSRLQDLKSHICDIRSRLFGGEAVAEALLDYGANLEDILVSAHTIVTKINDDLDTIFCNL